MELIILVSVSIVIGGFYFYRRMATLNTKLSHSDNQKKIVQNQSESFRTEIQNLRIRKKEQLDNLIQVHSKETSKLKDEIQDLQSQIDVKVEEVKTLEKQKELLFSEKKRLTRLMNQQLETISAESDVLLRTSKQIWGDQLLKKDEEFEQMKIELETCIRKKDDLYELMTNKRNETISRISSLFSDYKHVQHVISEEYVRTKKHPAPKEALRIKELTEKSKVHFEQYRQMVYKYETLLQLFPELENYVDDFSTIQELENIESIVDLQEEYDRTQFYLKHLSKDEFNKLSSVERNQLALDKYLSGKKSKWQIGRDYELYCGQLYEQDGWSVEYIGMERKLNDLGRDLIAKKNLEVHVIQCKYWAQYKEIHENSIAQLFGTTAVFGMDNNTLEEVTPVLMTNISLSETALKFASKLGVKFVKQDLKDFPRIKCNVGIDEYGEKTMIYHLPFDQQYDKTQIKYGEESYAWTVEEAELKGFRRAFKYRGAGR